MQQSNIAEIQNVFESEAEKGWFYCENKGYLYSFKKGQAKKLKFRHLPYLDKLSDKEIDKYAQDGWEFVGAMDRTAIFCGKKYYGDYLDRMPTSTESAIGKDKNTAQVTLCFAKDSISPYSVGDNITSALGKYAVYKSENLDVDLLFRAGAECNSAWGLAEKFGCSVEDVRSYNDIESPELNQAVLNPAIKGMKAFSGHVKVVDGTKTDNITFGN